MGVPHVKTKILKRKKYEIHMLRSKKKVHQKTEKYLKFKCDECEYKCSKKDKPHPYRRG